jgi:hypothetical protein
MPVNSMPLIQLPRHPRERIVHGTVGSVRVSSGWRAYELGFINPQFVACLRAAQAAPTVLPGDAVVHTALNSLSSLISHISTEGQETMTSNQGGTAARKKAKVAKIIN